MAGTFQQWQYLDPMSQQTGGVPGASAKTFPIRGNGPEPWFRDHLDALRSARVPTAQYPDGYLGTTINRRREDRLSNGGPLVAERPYATMRNYQRGIHVGSRVLPQAYFWDEDVHPMAGLEHQAAGKRWAPQGELITYLANDGKPGPVRGSQSLEDQRRRIPDRLHPRWK